MALNTEGLKVSIYQILTDMESRHEDSKEEFANRLAEAIELFVKSGIVKTNVSSGIPVSTTGSAVAQTGFTVASGSGVGYIE